MIEQIYNNLVEGIDVRQNLITLKEQLKDSDNQDTFLGLLKYDFTLLRELLQASDPKIRKNTALIIGEMELVGLGAELLEAYKTENTLFVKSAYLKAFMNISCEPQIPYLTKRLEELLKYEALESERKHISEEIRQLTDLLGQYESLEKHRFIGYDEPAKVILTTNRLHQDVTLNQIENVQGKKVAGGVAFSYKDMREFADIRTYSEILFPLPSAKNLTLEPKEVVHTILLAGIIKFIESRHLGSAPFRFRVELRAKLSPDNKRDMVKKLALCFEQESKNQLINSTSDYEVEIRLVETKNETFNVYLKLYTIPDHRFDYRVHTLATSINPVTAATVMELARPYLTQGAQVLDPFCGTGTMLIERSMALEAHPLYGIDTYSKAIDYARENTQKASMTINYINRDYEEFKHDYLFDEIITNMPAVIGVKTEREIDQVYALFFEKVPIHLKDQGIIVMYSADPSIAQKHIKKNLDIELLEKYQIYQKEGSYLFILRYNQ